MELSDFKFATKPRIADKLYFPYILFGKAVVTKFEDLSDGFYMYDHIKLFIGAYLFKLKNGPHNGHYNNNSAEFFLHDMQHMGDATYYFTRNKNYNECADLYRNARLNSVSSFIFRYVCIVLFLTVFELVSKNGSEDSYMWGKSINKNLDKIGEVLMSPHIHLIRGIAYEPKDMYYCMNWIFATFNPNSQGASKIKTMLSYCEMISRSEFTEIIEIYSKDYLRINQASK